MCNLYLSLLARSNHSFVYGSIHSKESSAMQTERWQWYARVCMHIDDIYGHYIVHTDETKEQIKKNTEREALRPKGEQVELSQ
jgi:hypothetical protein